jgi:hypothetical protein
MEQGRRAPLSMLDHLLRLDGAELERRERDHGEMGHFAVVQAQKKVRKTPEFQTKLPAYLRFGGCLSPLARHSGHRVPISSDWNMICGEMRSW